MTAPENTSPMREVSYQVSEQFGPILSRLGVSLIVSTYQAGKLCVLGTHQGELRLSFHNFDRAMGIASSPDMLAVGTRSQIVTLLSAPSVARGVPPENSHDAAWLARRSAITGDFHVHEMAWSGGELWVVNTLFSCLSTIDEQHSFVPRWKPPFIKQLAPEDRCHLNGLAMRDGLPGFVTAMSQTNSAQGWRPVKAHAGVVIDVETAEVVVDGLSMPHSPRVNGQNLWLLNSGMGQLLHVELESRERTVVEVFPGYTRGLALHGRFAFVGLSRIRERSTFGGVPLAEHRDKLRCAIAIVDLQSGKAVAFFEFTSGVEEIFDVQVTPFRNPAIVGPSSDVDETGNVWLIPPRYRDENNSFSRTQTAESSTDQAASSAGPVAQSPGESTRSGAGSAYNSGNAFMRDDRLDEAIEQYRMAVKESPSFAQAYCNLGIALCHAGHPKDSVKVLEKALTLSPGMAIARFNRGLARLTAGDFERGFDDYECRWCLRGQDNRPRSVLDVAPVWSGESLTDRSILVYPEQGVGDEIMFASCLPDLISQAGRVVIGCDRRLVGLFQQSFPDAEVVPVEKIAHPEGLRSCGHIDFVSACGSLPRWLRRTESDFPVAESFLKVDAEQRSLWRDRLNARNLNRLLTVGISWRGGKNSEEQARRSLSLKQLLPVLTVPGVQFVNLQYGDTQQELVELKDRHGIEILSFQEINPLLELDHFAALIANLDLVLSIDNSTVHLAGAIGAPVMAMVCGYATSSWRWLKDRDDSLWYRSVRVDWKRHRDDWSTCTDSIRAQLLERAVADCDQV